MNGTIKGLVAVAALFGTIACSDASPTGANLTAPEAPRLARPGSGSTLTFSYTQSYETATPQTASGATGAINFTGSIWTGNPCVDVTATHNSSTGNVTVTVAAAPNGSACIQVITNNNYTGSVSGLAPGSYNFTVVHKRGNTSETAFTGNVTVS